MNNVSGASHHSLLMQYNQWFPATKPYSLILVSQKDRTTVKGGRNDGNKGKICTKKQFSLLSCHNSTRVVFELHNGQMKMVFACCPSRSIHVIHLFPLIWGRVQGGNSLRDAQISLSSDTSSCSSGRIPRYSQASFACSVNIKTPRTASSPQFTNATTLISRNHHFYCTLHYSHLSSGKTLQKLASRNYWCRMTAYKYFIKMHNFIKRMDPWLCLLRFISWWVHDSKSRHEEN